MERVLELLSNTDTVLEDAFIVRTADFLPSSLPLYYSMTLNSVMLSGTAANTGW